MPTRFLVDASFLTSLIRTKDSHHCLAHQFYERNPDAVWVVPTLAYFEFQAAQSRGGEQYRDVYICNLEIFELTLDFIRRCREQQLFEKFGKLRGADLVYACIAHVERIALVTFDRDFNVCSHDIPVVMLTT
ncbi:MAG TPA: PIN domain-containing protein [Methylomirabilota bacterium]|nr:PIN domain-containing protein [Methylomirabilota bacterium]